MARETASFEPQREMATCGALPQARSRASLREQSLSCAHRKIGPSFPRKSSRKSPLALLTAASLRNLPRERLKCPQQETDLLCVMTSSADAAWLCAAVFMASIVLCSSTFSSLSRRSFSFWNASSIACEVDVNATVSTMAVYMLSYQRQDQWHARSMC